ncbi:LPS-assembly protein LptD [Telmatospirillum sp. J64-1]|uniref:LPS-assembly protein LptD n=1 Tax=Telmatospirillum sp. J64-1 TaxID=2502183 RepID=UPI00163D891F|nr:LPS assembly protein LptD [Telmatospirillum sp. J64-1]
MPFLPHTARRLAATTSLLTLLVLAPWTAAQAQPDSEQPVHLSAEELIHDQELDLVTAKGEVEIIQAGRVLVADTVTYNLRTDVVTASGNVRITEPTGEVLFAEYVELTGDLRDGLAQNIRLLLADRSRLAAASARRMDGEVSELEYGVYTACEPCRENPERAPLWQIKAVKVIHDQPGQTISFNHAWLEMFGVPVAYVPYFSHPDPTVERKSGLLPPIAGNSSNLGIFYRQPYHHVFSESHDMTISPMITAREGAVLVGEHRRRFTHGQMITEGSITHDSEGDTLSHIRAEGDFHLNQDWRAGWTLERATNATYMRRYGFGRDAWLTTQPWAEGFLGNDYARIEAFSFQEMRQVADRRQTPLVLPYAQYSYVGDTGEHGDYWTIDSNILHIARDEGPNVQRIGLQTGWQMPLITPGGSVYRFSTSLRTDAYYVTDPEDRPDDSSVLRGRVVPEVAVEWRYPMEKRGENYHQVLEPVVIAAVSPRGGNRTSGIPNEDSRDLEFDDTNLFSTNRYTGWDRLETGPRITYGLQWNVYGDSGGTLETMFGQTARLYPEGGLGPASGMDDRLSDYVGRIRAIPAVGGNLGGEYRFRLDKDDFSLRRSEVNAWAGPPLLRGWVSYTYLDGERGSGEFVDAQYGTREQVTLALSSALTQHWSVFGSTTRDLSAGPRGRLVTNGLGVTYEDECFIFSAVYEGSNAYDREYDGGDSVMFRLVFKTLGELPVDVYSQPRWNEP